MLNVLKNKNAIEASPTARSEFLALENLHYNVVQYGSNFTYNKVLIQIRYYYNVF